MCIRDSNIIQQEYATSTRKTAFYYVNTNDGVLEIADSNTSYSADNIQIESLANSIAVLDEGVKYKGSTCTDKTRRIFIRVEYEEADYKMIRVDK